MDFGAASSEIKFSDYPTKVSIDTGASSVKMMYPKDTGVVVSVDSGLTSVILPEFIKKDGKYYSPGYDPSKENIEINIDAGASNIEGEFY